MINVTGHTTLMQVEYKNILIQCIGEIFSDTLGMIYFSIFLPKGGVFYSVTQLSLPKGVTQWYLLLKELITKRE